MSEYCEYMWDPTRGRLTNTALARSIYDDNNAKFDVRDKKLAIKTVRAILREMPGVDLKHCTDEYITRFLLARKYRTEQAASLIAAYQSQIAHRQDIFGNLTARDPPLQRALRAGIPGVLPARDRKGRCVLVILASQWDPIAVPALSVQRAIFLVLETLIQDPRNQQCGFVAVVDWSGFSLRQGGALGAAALRNLIAALRGRFPARFKAVHFLSPPLYVQATLALVKPFLDEKTRHKIYLHGNNLSTLHEHLPTDILPAELGGTGPAFNPGLWAEPVIHSAMKEAEIAAIKRDQEIADRRIKAQKKSDETSISDESRKNHSTEATMEKRTPGNGEATSDLEESMILDAEESHGDSTTDGTKGLSRDSRDFERPDGRESIMEISSNNVDSPLIDAKTINETKRKKKSSRIAVSDDFIDEINSNENIHDSSIKEEKNNFAMRNMRIAENRETRGNNRETDDRTRFRIYRDNVNGNDHRATVGMRENEKINNGDDDVDCQNSETNSNEFEMISSQPESEESRENSLETLRIDAQKVTSMKSTKNGILPEEANLITLANPEINCQP